MLESPLEVDAELLGRVSLRYLTLVQSWKHVGGDHIVSEIGLLVVVNGAHRLLEFLLTSRLVVLILICEFVTFLKLIGVFMKHVLTL